jgi:hypothetical protein
MYVLCQPPIPPPHHSLPPLPLTIIISDETRRDKTRREEKRREEERRGKAR